MSDRFWGKIMIGGEISPRTAAKLAVFISGNNLFGEYGETPFIPNSADDLALRASETGGYLKFSDDEASWGQFGELEHFLVQHKIPYDRQSEAKYEYDAELIVYRPESGLVRYPTDQDGNVLVPAETARKAIASIRKGRLWEALAVLEGAIGNPPLPPFVIRATAGKRGGGRGGSNIPS